jgi:hypothetical protein
LYLGSKVARKVRIYTRAMPLEGHWQRQQTPLRALGRRELRVLKAFGAMLAIAVAAVIVISAIGGSTTAKAGCIDVTVPSTTGGANARACGSDAARYCKEQLTATTRDARNTLKACKRAGFLAASP